MFKNILFTLMALADLILIGASTVVVPMSAMMFDAGETPMLWAKFYGMALVPVLALIGIVAGLIWLLVFKQQDTALWLVGAPLIYLMLYAIFFVVA